MRAFVGPAVAAIVIASSQARADDPAGALFDRGLALMQAGDFAKACPVLAESNALDPRPGVLFTLAECEARYGRLERAVRHYTNYLALHAALPADRRLQQGDRDKIAREQVARLRPLVPELTLVLHPYAPRGTLIWRDGDPVPPQALGAPIPLDPGDHIITTQGPNAPVTQTRVTLGRGEKKVMRLLPALPSSSRDEPALGPAEPPPPTTGPGAQSVAGWVLGGVGVAGLVAGAIAGGLAMSKKGIVDDNCGIRGVPEACNREGKSAADSLKALALASTIGFVAGGTGVGVGVVLLATRPKEKAVSVALGGTW